MNSAITERNNAKTNADQQSKIYQMQAAAALRKGNFAQMFEFDHQAMTSRQRAHVEFFETGLKAINAELNPMPKTSPMPRAAQTTCGTRRVIKIAR